MTDKTVELAMELIRRPSVTPDDAGCQELMISRLAPLDFEIHRLRFGAVDNFWARRGTSRPLVVFAGHTDVVPTGPQDKWSSHPFEPVVRDGFLFGRGAADMKGSLAAFITSIEDFVNRHPDHSGSIGLLITSDEEGPSVDGTVKVVEWLEARGEKIDCCLVGEPSCVERLGDTIKNGRRGSLNGQLAVHGRQGHVAYPHLARNPIHLVAPALAELAHTEWDRGNEFFPPTTFQVSNVHSGTGADNVIPGLLELKFNFRFSPAVTVDDLKIRFENTLRRHLLDYEIRWNLSGHPFLTTPGALVQAVQDASEHVVGIRPALSTGGGTSDGRFIAPTGAQVVELGPLNATIHQVDECVAVEDLARLSRIYAGSLERLLT